VIEIGQQTVGDGFVTTVLGNQPLGPEGDVEIKQARKKEK
jgi:hypothetical protein